MKLVILDRDGVINHESDDFIKTESEWEAIPGSMQAIGRLTLNGYRIIVISNQSGLARGKLGIRELNRIHMKMYTHASQFGGVIEAIFFCPHRPEQGCNCRKPATGLFEEVETRLRTTLKNVPVIGDRISDVEAAMAMQARPIVVRTGKGQEQIDQGLIADEIECYDDLAAAVAALLDQE